jgi:hypothetical protein
MRIIIVAVNSIGEMITDCYCALEMIPLNDELIEQMQIAKERAEAAIEEARELYEEQAAERRKVVSMAFIVAAVRFAGTHRIDQWEYG